ncbi:MAG: primosomal protein N', partial [Arsenophonus sp. ET-DL12-MAG3]
MTIVQVALHIPLMKTFDYQLPKNIFFPSKGCRVVVHFGKQKKTILGIVLSHNQSSKFNYKELKTIEQVLDQESLFSDNLWSLLLWASKYYHYPIGEVLFHTLPVLLRKGE